jgi:hypothetical protein
MVTLRRTDGDMFFAEVRPFEELFRQGDNASANQQQSQQSQGPRASGMAEELGELAKEDHHRHLEYDSRIQRQIE